MTDYTYTVADPSTGRLSDRLARVSDDATIPLDLVNRDYQEFLAWIDEGNPAPEGWTGPKNE
jgi:hypothetical protein